MKKYNTPEIEALALETIDVIATSGNRAAEEVLESKGYKLDNAQTLDASEFTSAWSW